MDSALRATSAKASTAFVQSYKDGENAGEASVYSNTETDGSFMRTAGFWQTVHLPVGDIKSRFMDGCMAGTIFGLMKLDQGNG